MDQNLYSDMLSRTQYTRSTPGQLKSFRETNGGDLGDTSATSHAFNDISGFSEINKFTILRLQQLYQLSLGQK